MSKTKSKKKQSHQPIPQKGKANGSAGKQPKEVESGSGDDDSSLIPDEDLEITTEVLQLLATAPELLRSSRFKELKRAGWEFGKVLGELGGGVGNSIHSRISHALSLSMYRQALIMLFEMHVNRIQPKLGALQRWVRECDATTRPEHTPTAEERDERQTVLKCLDMVLRVCGGQPNSSEFNLDSEVPEDGSVSYVKPWRVRRTDLADRVQPPVPLWDLLQSGVASSSSAAAAASGFALTSNSTVKGFRVVQRTPGHMRKPPNVFDSTVWASEPSGAPWQQELSEDQKHGTHTPAIPFPPCDQPTFSATHPSMNTCRMILNVLSPETCRAIVSTANELGWEPDQAAGGSAVEKTSVLAHNVVWLADQDFVEELFTRIRPFVEETVNGGKVRGINRRFRVYRSSPSDDPLWSRYTILIYLNEDINASASAPNVPGATTFFVPHPTNVGMLLACPIAPVQGAILVFPHGDARGSLLHEGSPVGDGGWKCVIRTDLLYEAEGFGEFAPRKKVAEKDTKRKRQVVDGDGVSDDIAPSKIARVVSVGEPMKVKEIAIPKSVGEQNLGEGLEGFGG